MTRLELATTRPPGDESGSQQTDLAALTIIF